MGVHGITRWVSTELLHAYGGALLAGTYDPRTNRWVSTELGWVSTELLALYMPAMSAVRHDVRAKAFYEALTGRGKKKIQAQCAVMRKYLVGIWACMQTQTTFDSTLLFSEKHLNH